TIKTDYASRIDAFYDRFCSIENGQASKYIGDMIYNEIMKK
ncbi:CDP-glycerol glycerophosphotransferase family protein, partial [Staphylococcus arlettae]